MSSTELEIRATDLVQRLQDNASNTETDSRWLAADLIATLLAHITALESRERAWQGVASLQRARAERLLTAMEPFAKVAVCFAGNSPHDYLNATPTFERGDLKVEHFRRAHEIHTDLTGRP